MKALKQILCSVILICYLFDMAGCKKFLNAKSNQSLVIPSSVEDLQALLDDYARINQFDPSASERSADDYYLTSTDWSAITDETDRNMYIWQKENLFPITGNTDWSYSYDNVYRANVVLAGIDNIEQTALNTGEWNSVKGQAFFIRAKNFLQIAYIWAPAYDAQTSTVDLGIPLRLDPDFNKVSVRSSVEETYRQIINDLQQACTLLPVNAVHIIRPCKAAAYALLARTYLSMRIYDKALLCADSCLRLNSTLVDYNTLNVNAAYPFAPRFSNAEDIMDTYMQLPVSIQDTKAKIDTVLYESYNDNDLRKTVFFGRNADNSYKFKGSYIGSHSLFDGIALDEVYLMKAECLARTGNIEDAMNVLNQLLVKRWKIGTFIAFAASDEQEALNIILAERRKELLMRGLRWMDIKRLNKEGANITLTRTLNGQVFTLLPDDLRYALPIPEDVISISGMKQNPR